MNEIHTDPLLAEIFELLHRMRHWIGFELDPRCEAMQVQRMQQPALELEVA